MAREIENFLTQELYMKILRDNAIFSDTNSSKTRAVNELARRYKTKAIPIIEEVINSVFDDEGFTAFCINVIRKIKEDVTSDKD